MGNSKMVCKELCASKKAEGEQNSSLLCKYSVRPGSLNILGIYWVMDSNQKREIHIFRSSDFV